MLYTPATVSSVVLFADSTMLSLDIFKVKIIFKTDEHCHEGSVISCDHRHWDWYKRQRAGRGAEQRN
jgi:hypothetical protein